MESAIVPIQIAEPSYTGAPLPVIERLSKPGSSTFVLPWANRIVDLSALTYVSVFHTPGTCGGKLLIRSLRKCGNLHRRRWLVLFNVNDAACLYAFGPNGSPDSSHPWLRLCLAEDAESRFPVCFVLDRDQPLSVAAHKNGAAGARESAVHCERLIGELREQFLRPHIVNPFLVRIALGFLAVTSDYRVRCGDTLNVRHAVLISGLGSERIDPLGAYLLLKEQADLPLFAPPCPGEFFDPKRLRTSQRDN